MLTRHDHTAVIRLPLKNNEGKFFFLLGFEPWSPGTETQCATNELSGPLRAT